MSVGLTVVLVTLALAGLLQAVLTWDERRARRKNDRLLIEALEQINRDISEADERLQATREELDA